MSTETESKETKRAMTESDPDLGEEYNEIIKQLRNSDDRYGKNKCLMSIPYEMKFRAKQILDKKILDAEFELNKARYELKKAEVQFRQLKQKRELFEPYIDDPY